MKNKNSIDIFIKMSNGDTFDNKKTTVSNYLAALFLYNLFDTGERFISILKKWALANIFWDNDSIYDLLQYYRKRKGMSEDVVLSITLRVKTNKIMFSDHFLYFRLMKFNFLFLRFIPKIMKRDILVLSMNFLKL